MTLHTGKPLNDKHRAFVAAYISNGFNGAKAAITAGYSEASARFQASRLLTNVDIAAAIADECAAHIMTGNEVLARLSAIARGDVDGVEVRDQLKALEMLAKYHNLINTVKIEDWRSQAIADIKAGRIQFQALAKAFDYDLATELFMLAGVIPDDDVTPELN